jgi:hypothetical protein
VLPGQVLPAEQNLHERVVRQAACRVQPLDQDLEGDVLMLVGGQAAGAHLIQKLGERGVCAQVDPQDQGVDEEPHQIVERRVTSSGNREAHGHIGTGAQLGQQHGQRGLDHHEAGGVVLARHTGDPLLQLRRPAHLDRGAPLIGHRRIGPIGGQVEAFRQPGEGLLPVGQLLGDRAAVVVDIAQLRTLPQGVVDVLHRERFPAGCAPRTPAGIGQAQIGDQRSQRPAVGGDMVHHGNQEVFVVRRAEKTCPHRDLRTQVEDVLPCGADALGQMRRRPATGIDHIPADLGLFDGDDGLLRCPVPHREHGPQALVPGDHVGQRRPQRAGVEPATQPQGNRHVVHRRRALQLVDEPQPVLREGQRDDVGSLHSDHRGLSGNRFADPLGQLGDGGRLEHGTHRQLGAQRAVDRRDQPHRRQ